MNKIIYIKNSITSIALLCANVCFSLFFISFFVRSFGLELFSTFSILLQLSAAFILLSSPLNTVLSRHLIADDNGSHVYSGAVKLITGFLFILFSVVTIFSCIYLNVGALNSFLFLGGTFFFCLSLNENSYFFKSGKLHIQNSLQIINIFFKVLFFLLFSLFFEPVLSFSISFFIVNFIHLILMRFILSRNGIYFSRFDFPSLVQLKIVCNESKYLFINSFGAVLIRNLDLIVIAAFLSATESGKYSLYLQIVSLLRLLTEALSSSIAPKIMKSAIHDKVHFRNNFSIFLKLINYTICTFAVFTYLNIELLWNLWVGDSLPLELDTVAVLLLASGVTGGFYAFTYVQNAFMKNKIPSLISLISGAIYILLGALILIKELSLLHYATCYAIILIAKNFIFSAYYNSLISDSEFYSNIYSSVISFLPPLILGSGVFLISKIYSLPSIYVLICSLIAVFVSLLCFYSFCLSVNQRVFLLDYLRRTN